MNKYRIVIGTIAALLMSPVILLGALAQIIAKYFMCGFDIMGTLFNKLEAKVAKHDKSFITYDPVSKKVVKHYAK